MDSQMDPEARERLSALEAQIHGQSRILERVETTLDKLVRSSIQNEENRKRIEALEVDADRLESQHVELKAWIESRWYVLATIAVLAAAAGSMLADLVKVL